MLAREIESPSEKGAIEPEKQVHAQALGAKLYFERFSERFFGRLARSRSGERHIGLVSLSSRAMISDP